MTPEQELVIERARAFVAAAGEPAGDACEYADLYNVVEALDAAERPSLVSVIYNSAGITLGSAKLIAERLREAGLVKDEA